MGTREAAKVWGVRQETVQKWCRDGLIDGVNQDKKGSPWHIPKTAIPPRRNKKGEEK